VLLSYLFLLCNFHTIELFCIGTAAFDRFVGLNPGSKRLFDVVKVGVFKKGKGAGGKKEIIKK